MLKGRLAGLGGLAAGAFLIGLVLPATVDPDPEPAVRAGAPAADAAGAPVDSGASSGGSEAGDTGVDAAAGIDAPTTGRRGPSAAGSTASGDVDSPAGNEAAEAGEPTPASRGASAGGSSDVGVTATTVKVGFLLLDIASATRIAGGLTGIDPEQQRRAAQVYVDEINARGGIQGRRIVPEYRTFDVLSRDDQRAACLELVEDKKVFAVIAAGGFGGPPVLCVTQEHRTPLINLSSGGTPRQYVDRSAGMLFTIFQLGDRQMSSWVAELDARNALRGKAIGILSDESSDPGDLVIGGSLLPSLRAAGHTVTHRSRLSADLAVGAGQIGVEVQQMRSKGVEVVLLPAFSTYSSQFVQAAGQQRWSPSWYASDFGNMSSAAIARNMPENFEGSLATTVTRVGEETASMAEPSVDRGCRERYERAAKERLPRMKDGEYNNTYGTTLYACGMIDLLAGAVDASGPTLTRAAFSRSLQAAGSVPLPRFGGGAFRPGKFDAADLVRTVRWHGSCTCWKPVDQFHQPRG